jgi:hypothetical protein
MCMITKEIALFVFDEDLLQGIRDGGGGGGGVRNRERAHDSEHSQFTLSDNKIWHELNNH